MDQSTRAFRIKQASQTLGRIGLTAALLGAVPAVGERWQMQAEAVQVQFAQGRQVFLNAPPGGFVILEGPGGIAGQADASLVPGFSVQTAGADIGDTPAGEAMKLMQAGEWLKAIDAINRLDETDKELMVTDANGILRPLSSLKASLMASLPEEGRRTFRELNEPTAKSLLGQAKQIAELNQRETAYQALVDGYMLCDAAAQAADLLGDIRFEQGRFNEASELYRFSADHPAAKSDDPMLMAKRLITLARAERWDRFDTLADYAAFRHPDTAVTLGGQSKPVGDLIGELSKLRTKVAEDTAPDTAKGKALGLPKQMQYAALSQELISPDQYKRLHQHASSSRVQALLPHMLKPIVASDGERLFVLSLSGLSRLDPETGTELWREGTTEDAINGFLRSSSRVRYLQYGYHQSLTLAGDTLLSVVPDRTYPSRSFLTARNADTHELKWEAQRSAQELNNRSIIGEPIVVDDTVYALSMNRGESQLMLVALSLQNGALQGSTILGAASNDQNLGGPAEMSPRLAMGQGYLMVQTNNGALIAVDPRDLSIAWAFTQGVRNSIMGQIRNHGGAQTELLARFHGDVITHDGIVIAKDTRSNKIHALREYDAKPLWVLPTGNDATIVHHDSRHFYVLAGEVDSSDGTLDNTINLVAHDLRTGKPVWWVRNVGDDTGRPVFTDHACFIAGNKKIARVSLKTGKLTEFDTTLAEPGDLVLVNDKLIHTTLENLRGYRLRELVEKAKE